MEKETENSLTTKQLNIYAIQMSSEIGNKEANFVKVEKLIANGISPETDIIILPEVWTVGWKPSVFKDSAEELKNSETIKFLSELAKKYNAYVIGGSFITKEGKREKGKGKREQQLFNSSTFQPFNYFNTCPIINRQGELIAKYDKMHLFSYYGCDEGGFIEHGKNPKLVDIDGIKIGISICYDIRFPEIYRSYRQAGADVLINMAAWPMKRAVHWEALSKARAIENQCFMVALTQSGQIEGEEYNLGHSRIIDFNGEVISEIKQNEGAMFAEIKFDDMYQFREKCTVLCDIHKNYDVK